MIRRLLYLNGIAILGAVIYHANGWGYTALFWWTDRYAPVNVPNFDQLGTLSYYGLRLTEQLVIFVIPAFLFVSGFFIAFATGRSQQTVSWHIVGVRIKNLVIPYLVWSIAIIALDMAQGAAYSPEQILRKLVVGGAAPPYYYVPLLCQMYLLAPFLVPLARHRWQLLLLVAALLQLTTVALRYVSILDLDIIIFGRVMWLTQSWLFPGHIFWFTFGVVTGFHLPVFKQRLAQVKWWLLAAVVITFLAGLVEWELLLAWSGQDWIAARETMVDNFYSMAVLLSFVAFEQLSLPLYKQIGDLGSKSFGIYLSHTFVLEYTARGVYHLAPWLLGYQILFQALLIGVGVAIPLAMMSIVRRSPARRLYPYLFG